MLIYYVKPFEHWREGYKRSSAIHERCMRAYELECEGEALYERRKR